jgi:hypothetical protein
LNSGHAPNPASTILPAISAFALSLNPAKIAPLAFVRVPRVHRRFFDPVDAGPLKNSLRLEPDGSPIAATHSADELIRLVSN